jgi:hypothetical protein
MLVPMINADLNLDAITLLALLMTMTYVPLTNAKKMEKSLILPLIAMIKTHVLPIVVVNPPDNANTKLLNAKTTMLALLILAVLNLVATTKLLFAMINLVIPSLATLIMGVNGNVLSAMMKISVLLITVTLRLTVASFLTSFVMITINVPQISVLKEYVTIMLSFVMTMILALMTLAIVKMVNAIIKLSTVTTITSVLMTIVTKEFVTMMKSPVTIMMLVP